MNVFDLVIHDKERSTLGDVFLEEPVRSRLIQIVREHRYADYLLRYGLPINNKVLLHGSSGCGKTLSAKALAAELGKNILVLNLANVVCARIGETSQNIRVVFEKTGREKAVLFLDEFDLIGKARGGNDKDVGEMRRLVNALIQLIDYFPADALLICATNHPEIIDSALLRRFQVKVAFEMPGKQVLDGYYDSLLSKLPENMRDIERVYGISFAEARDYAFTELKEALINELDSQATDEGP